MSDAHDVLFTPSLFHPLLWGWFALAAITFVSLFFIRAPYGRHARSGFGPQVDNRLGWVIMEAPASLGVLAWVIVGPRTPLSWLLCALWQAHYAYRAFLFPFRQRSPRPMPLVVALSGAL